MPMISYGSEISNNLSLSLGSWMENYNNSQMNREGEMKKLEFNPYISVSYHKSLKNEFSFVPEIGYVFQRENEGIKKNILYLRSDFTYHISQSFFARLGTSFITTMLSSNGGEKELQNGDSTEIYYLPNETSYAYNQTLDIGLEYKGDDLNMRFTTYLFSLDDPQRQSINISLSLDFYLGKKENR